MTIRSALVANEAFIQGQYLSIGINRVVCLGSKPNQRVEAGAVF